MLKTRLELDELIYIGFGSIWFTDFLLAHRVLRIRDMISIEGDEVGYRRAAFNAPFATVRVINGLSGAVLPDLLSDVSIRQRPWIVWLDYDKMFDESAREDLQLLIENSPANTILITTFNGHEMEYGRAPDRVDRLKTLFGGVVPENLSKASCKGDRMHQTLADLALDYLEATAAEMSRPGGFVPCFRAIYQDNAPMVTVGGILPTKVTATLTNDVIASADWPSRPSNPIKAPHLTTKEAANLQALLPCNEPLCREQIRELGFDLEESQIEAYERYYRQYPAFAQIIS